MKNNKNSSYIILEGVEKYDFLIDPLTDWYEGDRTYSVSKKLFDYKDDIRELCAEMPYLKPPNGDLIYRVVKISDDIAVVKKILTTIKQTFETVGASYFSELSAFVKKQATRKAAAVTSVVTLVDFISYAEDFINTVRNNSQAKPSLSKLKAITDRISYQPVTHVQTWTMSEQDALSFGRGRSKETGEFFAVFTARVNDEVFYPTPTLKVLSGEGRVNEVYTDVARMSISEVTSSAQSIFMDMNAVYESIYIYKEV
jgi:hypothetical protein